MTCLTPKNQYNTSSCTFKCLPECPPTPKPRSYVVSSTQSNCRTHSPISAALLAFPVAHVEQVAPELDDGLEGFFLVNPSTASEVREHVPPNSIRMMPRFDFDDDESTSSTTSQDSISGALRNCPAFRLQPRYVATR
mmetsp:Transcript_10766/g.21556  ORF Transcript_10766/g.21556 Transcript_10766/m.21556 type:complete len:137 (-) Transcript_10766:98-508(-)